MERTFVETSVSLYLICTAMQAKSHENGSIATVRRGSAGNVDM